MADKVRLEIARIDDKDDDLWFVTLFNELDEPQIQSTTPLNKGVVLNVAKVLKHEGAKARVLVGKEEPDYMGWLLTVEKTDWVIALTFVTQTHFSFSSRKYDAHPDDVEVKRAMEEIESLLELADIQWNPPDQDPAIPYSDIETPTKGHPGSHSCGP